MAIILIGSGCFSPRLVICPSKHSVNKGSASIIRPRRRKFCASFQVALSAAGCLSPIKRVCVARTLCNSAAGVSRSPGRSSWATSAMFIRVTSASGWSGPRVLVWPSRTFVRAASASLKRFCSQYIRAKLPCMRNRSPCVLSFQTSLLRLCIITGSTRAASWRCLDYRRTFRTLRACRGAESFRLALLLARV